MKWKKTLNNKSYRFITYNVDWIGSSLGIEQQTRLEETPKMRPWNSGPFPDPDPAKIMERIGEESIRQIRDYVS